MSLAIILSRRCLLRSLKPTRWRPSKTKESLGSWQTISETGVKSVSNGERLPSLCCDDNQRHLLRKVNNTQMMFAQPHKCDNTILNVCIQHISYASR